MGGGEVTDMEAQLLFAWEPLPQRPGRESAGDAGCVLGRKKGLPSPTEEPQSQGPSTRLRAGLRVPLSSQLPFEPSEGFVSPRALPALRTQQAGESENAAMAVAP